MEIKNPSCSLATEFKGINLIKNHLLDHKIKFDREEQNLYFVSEEKVVSVNLLKEEYINEFCGNDRILLFTLCLKKKYLITINENLYGRLYDLQSTDCLHVWKTPHKRIVNSIAINKNGNYLASASTDKSIRIYDLDKKSYTFNFKIEPCIVKIMKFYQKKDQLYLISAHSTCHIYLWDLTKKECKLCIKSHMFTIASIFYLKDEQDNFVSVDKNGTILLWNIKTLDIKKTVELESMRNVENAKRVNKYLQFSSSSCIISNNESICIFDIITEKILFKHEFPHLSIIKTFQFLSPDENVPYIACVTSELDIITLNLNNKQIVHTFIGQINEVTDVKRIGPCDIILSGSSGNIIMFTIIDELKLKCTQMLCHHKEVVMSLDVSSDYLYIVSGSKDGNMAFWYRSNTLEPFYMLAESTSHTGCINNVFFSKDKNMFVVSCSDDHTIKRWDVKNCINSQILPTWTKLHHEKQVSCISISFNGEYIISGSADKTAILYDNQGSKKQILKGHTRGVTCAIFSNIDKVVITGSADKRIVVWSIVSGETLKVLEGHESSLTCLKFINNGIQLVSSATDGLIKVWCLSSFKCLSTLDQHDDRIWSFDTFDSEPYLIISGDCSGNIVYWKNTTVDMHEKEQERIKLEHEQNQFLNDCLYNEQFKDAAKYAIKLEYSRKVYEILSKIISKDDYNSYLGEIFEEITSNEIEYLCKLIVKWNTNSKYYLVAQIVLTKLIELKSINTIGQYINYDALISYTERHMKRLDKLIQSTYI